MLSKEKLLEAVNSRVAELVAEDVYQKIKVNLEERWNTVLQELAYSRKTSEHLKEALAKSQNQNARLEQLLNAQEAQLQRNRELQQKSAKILDETLKMIGVGE